MDEIAKVLLHNKLKEDRPLLAAKILFTEGKEDSREVSKVHTRNPANEKVYHCSLVFVPVLTSNNLQTYQKEHSIKLNKDSAT